MVDIERKLSHVNTDISLHDNTGTYSKQLTFNELDDNEEMEIQDIPDTMECDDNNYDINNLRIIKTAGGRSIFLADGKKVYKKDASGKEDELYDFYKYLDNKPDLSDRFPKFYGIVKVDKGIIESLIKSSPFPMDHRAQKVNEVNNLLCMENMCSYFSSPPWVLDLKMAVPKTSSKYHKSRFVHEFSIHGMQIPAHLYLGTDTNKYVHEISFDHKNYRDLDYDNFDQVYKILSDFFPSLDLVDKLIVEISDIDQMFNKYDFRFNCSLLVMHDTDRIVVKIIDCSMSKLKLSKKMIRSSNDITLTHQNTNDNTLKRLSFLKDLLNKIRIRKIIESY